MSETSDVGIRFRKQRAEYLLDCIETGKGIEPDDPQGWSHFEMLMTAGVLTLAAGSHPNWHGERYSLEDLFAALSTICQLTEAVMDNIYDVDYASEVKAVVRMSPTGDGMKVTFLSGHKGGDPTGE